MAEPKSILKAQKHAARADAPSSSIESPAISKFMRVSWTLAGVFLLVALAANGAIRLLSVDRPERLSSDGRVIIDAEYLSNIKYPKLMGFALAVTRRLASRIVPLSSALGEADGRKRAQAFFRDAKEYMLSNGVNAELVFNLTNNDSFLELDGEAYVRKAMSALDKDFENESVYHLLGRVTMQRFVAQGVEKNLVAKGLTMAFPEILGIPINKPIIVTGPPRTMTTHMQSLLAVHPSTESLTYVDGDQHYLLSKSFEEMLTDKDHRVPFLNFGMIFTNAVLPYFKKMMRYGPFEPYEDISNQMASMGSEVMPAIAYLPFYNSFWLDEGEDHSISFELLKKQQQVILWQRKLKFGEKYDYSKIRLLMKTPAHLMKIPPILKVYPDASWVITHRNPTEVAKSYVPMILYVWGMINDKLYPSPTALVDYLLGFIKVKTDLCVRDYRLLDPNRVINVNFNEFVANNQGVVTRVAEFLDLSTGAEFKEPLEEYVSLHKRNGASKFKYDLESFNVDLDELSNKFSAYVDRFVDKSDSEIKKTT